METVTIKTFDNYFSANIILTRLQDAGVHCFLKDEYTVTIDPILSNAIGGIKLQVNIEDADVAEKMLRQFEDEYLQSAQCPVCNAHDFMQVPKRAPGNILTAILTWMFSSYAVSVQQVYQCRQCGYESKTLPENITELN